METAYYIFNPWWEKKDFDSGIDRPHYLMQLPDFMERRQVEVMVGSRRIGKTTLLRQFIKKLLREGVPPERIFYLALDNPMLSGTAISDHLRNMRKVFMHDRETKLFLFLDEIQESPDWEIQLKSLYDTEILKIFCTGSTSSLIKMQGGRLTGRQITTVVYPLSFEEFLLFRADRPGMDEDYKYERLFEEYLQVGGYPENVLNPSMLYLGNLLDDILSRDLIRLYPIKKAFALRDLMKLVAAAVGSRTSFNKLGKVLGLAVDTVKEYMGYLETAFLVMPMPKWTMSYSEKVYASKKIYLWDTGIKTLLTVDGDSGAKMENAVFVELKRRNIDCGYFAASEKELDFVTGDARRPFPIEAKYASQIEWGDRRLAGLKLFLRRFPQTRKGLVITRGEQKEVKVNKTEISFVPAWRFFLFSGRYLQEM
ncbi:MAG: ATP-binding protein [Deltaproteobacteria bacterium]|nr:ATP-binding protein [Deltaproteobacteria bacterium]MBW2138064.1 ATP-binding protein [Deltaproteobacteria bacterium]